MSLKTRIEALEKRLAKPESEETVVQIREIVVHTREEVEQLRTAGVLDASRDTCQLPLRGPVRLVVGETVDAKDVSRTTPSTTES